MATDLPMLRVMDPPASGQPTPLRPNGRRRDRADSALVRRMVASGRRTLQEIVVLVHPPSGWGDDEDDV